MRIYVGTYAKYNSGSIQGAWLDLADYEDKEAFLEACQVLHQDEEDPELMFQDWEDIPSGLVSECTISADLWEIMEESDLEPVRAYLAIFGEWNQGDYQDRYHGQYNSWEDMATELLDSTGELEAIPENLRYYFDYSAYARDLRLGGDLCEHSGHFFWNH